jgi:hypothetical protein
MDAILVPPLGPHRPTLASPLGVNTTTHIAETEGSVMIADLLSAPGRQDPRRL